MRTGRTIVRGVAVLLVTLGGLAIPRSADADPSCDLVQTTLAYREDLEVVASAEAEVMESGYGGCWGIEYVQFPLALELQTPQDVFYDSTWGSGYGAGAYGSVMMDGVPIASYQGGFGWYVATSRVDYIQYYNPFENWEWGPWYGSCWQGCDYYVPSPYLELSGPTSTQQHSGVYISASLDPSFLVPAIDWQGCSPAQGNGSCLFPASTTGQHVITASIDGGPSDQWTVQVDP